MKKAHNILIAGFGDIGKRVAKKLRSSRHYRVTALIRKKSVFSSDPTKVRQPNVQMVHGDLGDPGSLRKITGLADTILHFAPPPGTGQSDTHTRNLLAALSNRGRDRGARPGMLPRRIVYISTTGVYGNCDGAWIDETRPVRPESARAKRRVDAEHRLRKWGRLHHVAVTILRAPGIYARDRLPLDRLKLRTPVLIEADDVFSNHIHADDLATAAINAMRQRWPKHFRVFNVIDDSQMRMGDYFDQVADAFGIRRPPRISRQHAEAEIAPVLLSFMRESRRIGNARVKRELKLALKYPTLASALSALRPTIPD
jgi:nucleoside-diphosphate-sugar epimerase